MKTTKKELEYLIQELRKKKLDPEVVKRVDQLFFSFEEVPKNYDTILILTSSAISRVRKAVEMYHQKRCPMILSGGSFLEKDKMIEAERFYLYAITHDVKEEDIFLELKSKNTKENLEYSIPLIKGNNCLLITSSQHLPRALLTAEIVKKELNREEITFIPCSSYAPLVPKDTWQNEEKAKEIIRGEMERLIEYKLIQ